MVTPLLDVRSNRTRPGSAPSPVAIDHDCRAPSKNMRGPQFEPLLDNVLCMHLWHRKCGANSTVPEDLFIDWDFERPIASSCQQSTADFS
jgi:hypothetical protein